MIRSWFARLFRPVSRKQSRRPCLPLRLVQLEDRTLLSAPAPYTSSFLLSNQNQFDAAATASALSNSTFLGGSFNTPSTSFGSIDHEVQHTAVGDIDLGYWGAQLNLQMSGQAGINVNFTANSDTSHNFGTFGSNFNATLNQGFSQPTHFGQTVTFDPSGTFVNVNSGNFSTTSPQFGYGAHLNLNLSGNMSGQFGIGKLFSPAPLSFSGGMDLPLFSVNENNSGEVDLMGLPIIGASTNTNLSQTVQEALAALQNLEAHKILAFGVSEEPPLDVAVTFDTQALDFKQNLDVETGTAPDSLGPFFKALSMLGSAGVNLGSTEEKAPAISLSNNTPGAGGTLTASGSDTIAALNLQAGLLASQLFPVLPPAALTEDTITLGPAKVSFTPLSFLLTPSLKAAQTVSLDPVSQLTYQFSSPVVVTLNGQPYNNGNPVSQVTFTPGKDALGIQFEGNPITVTPTWSVQNVLSNRIDLTADLDASLKVGEMVVKVPGLGEYDFGPLYEKDFHLASTTLENLFDKQITVSSSSVSLPSFQIGEGFHLSTIVNTVHDNNSPGPLNSSGVPTNNSLRDAILSADALNSASQIIIQLGAGTYHLNLQTQGQTDGSVGNLLVTAPNLKIVGVAGQTVISSATGDRVFDVASGAHLTLDGVTIEGGIPGNSQDPNEGLGGGILAESGSSLEVDHCVITENEAPKAGGGIFSLGSLTINNSTISNNFADTDSGGGIFVNGTVTIVNSTVSGNSAVAEGGGLELNRGTAVIESSTFSNNTVFDQVGLVSGGGGLCLINSSLTLINSTITANSATGFAPGGGIDLYYSSGVLINDTIAGNSAWISGGIEDQQFPTPAAVILQNTIVANNTSSNGDPDAHGTYTSAGHNLIGDPSGFTGLVTTDLHNVDPRLGPLSFTGGPTPTMRLLPASPAIDAGSRTSNVSGQAIPSSDQRGFPRPVGNDADIGAVEYEYDLGISGNVQINGNVLTYTLTVISSGPDTAGNVVASAHLPSGVTFQSFTHPAGWTESDPGVGQSGTVGFDISTLGTNQSATFTITAKLTAFPTAPVAVTAKVGPVIWDNAPGNNLTTLTVFNEGQPFQNALLFHFDSRAGSYSAGDFVATAHWGDGQTTSSADGSVSVVANPSGGFDVLGSHQYGDEGNYAVNLSVVSSDGLVSINGATSLAVADQPLTHGALTPPPVILDQPVQQSQLFHFVDTHPGVIPAGLLATVYWGDGTQNTSVDGSGSVTVVADPVGGFDVVGTHTYPAGIHGAITSVQVTDKFNQQFNSPVLFHFSDANPRADASDFTAKVSWADGTSNTSADGTHSVFVVPNPAGGFDVLGDNAYTAAIRGGTFTVTVTDKGGASTTASSKFSVDSALTPGTLTLPAVSTEGQLINKALLFHFSDGDPNGQASDFTATVVWGDGTTDTGGPVSVVANPQGGFDVIGSHTFGEVPAGATFGVHVQDVDGATTGRFSTSFSVSDPAVQGTGGFSLQAIENATSALQTVATFTDPAGTESISDYSASINWGDGTPVTTGTITFQSGVFKAQGLHLYAHEGQYTVTVTLAHDLAPNTTVTDTDTVSDPAVTATAGPSMNAVEGQDTGNHTVATFTDPGGADTLGAYQALIHWGDGTSSPGVVTVNSSASLGFVSPLATGNGPVSTAVADLNGDGKLDLAVANSVDLTIQIFLGNGDGTFGAPATYSLGDASPTGVVAADLNKDGKLDLVSVSSSTNTVSVLLNQGNGIFSAPVSLGTGVNGLNPSAVAVGDLNGDGKADLITADKGSNTISVFLGKGNGTFQNPVNVAVNGLNPAAVAVGDLNGDGKLDVAVADAGSDQVSVLFGNGGGGFGTPHTLSVGQLPSSLVLASLRGNGRLDIITANTASNDVSVVLNNGGGNFANALELAVGTAPVSVLAADMDGNNKLDLVVADNQSNAVAVLAGNGNGGFASPQSHSIGTSPNALAIGSLDGAGIPDLITTDTASNRVTLLLPTYAVLGHHLYAEESGSSPYTVTVTIDHGSAPTATVTTSAAVSDPAVTPVGTNASAVEGSNTSLVVATFTDPGGPEAVGDYSASINWGDGTPVSTGSIVYDSTTKVFTVLGNHVFAEESSSAHPGTNPYSITVTISHGATTPQTITSQATVSDPPVVVSPGSPMIISEGTHLVSQSMAAFTDPGASEPVSDYSAVIDWGDGSPTQTGTIQPIPALAGAFSVLGSHTYDEGSYTITVTISHEDTAPQVEMTPVIVTDPPVVLSPGAAMLATEGTSTGTQPLAAFTDPAGAEDLSNYSADVRWGDGSATEAGTIAYNSTLDVFFVSGSHTYAEEGGATITVTIHHENTATQTMQDSVLVLDPSVSVTGAQALAAVEGSSTGSQVLATFTDPAGAEWLGDYSADVSWGDATTTAGTITYDAGTHVFSVLGSHTYAEEGSYTIQVTIHHDSSQAQSVSIPVTVSDPAVMASGGLTISGEEGASTGTQTLATFTDPGGAEALNNYSADVSWGDGSASEAGTISYDAGTHVFRVLGSHKYAEEGSYPITITIHHDGAAPQTVSSAAMVSDPSVVAPPAPPRFLFEGTSMTSEVLVTFTDPGGSEPVSDYSADIDWGDGSASQAGTITFNSTFGFFSVVGSHTYGDEGTYTIQVTLHHDNALPVIATSSVVVADANVVATAVAPLSSVEGSSTGSQVLATFTDPAGAEGLGDYSANVSWGDGTATAGTISYDAGTHVFSVLGSHNYAEEGSDTITVTIHHDSSQAQSVSIPVTVFDPAVMASGGLTISGTEGAPLLSQSVATFTDPGGPEALGDYSADITWGDGTTTQVGAGSISFSAGVFTVSAAGHVYAEEGRYPITVLIHHEATAVQSVTSTVQVADAPLATLQGLTLSASQDIAFTAVAATFTDPGGPEALTDYSATIAWSDGSTSAGSIGRSGSTFTVSGTHGYGKVGTYPLTVTLRHDQLAPVSVSGSVVVSANAGLLLLDPTGKGALSLSGNASLTAQGEDAVYVDSSSSSAIQLSGNALARAEEFDVTGATGLSTGGNAALQGKLKANQAVLPDPLAGLPVPPMTGPTYGAVNASGQTSLTLTPGIYVGGISVSGKATVTLTPGIYVLKGGGLSVTGQGLLAGNGVLLYDAPQSSNDGITISGQGSVVLTPLTSGPDQGVALFEDRSATAAVTVSGNGSLSVTGALYATGAAVSVGGNGTLAVLGNALSAAPGRLIVADASISGNGQVTVGQPLPVQAGQSATPVYWNGATGQQLLQSFNGGPTATALGNWLAASFSNLYGSSAGANNLAGKSNAQVATYFQSLVANNQTLAAQVLATALNLYATTDSLGGSAAVAYGFLVSGDGLGAAVVNVGSDGAAFGVANGSMVSVLQALQAANRKANHGVLYNGDATLSAEALEVFTAINLAGGIA